MPCKNYFSVSGARSFWGQVYFVSIMLKIKNHCFRDNAKNMVLTLDGAREFKFPPLHQKERVNSSRLPPFYLIRGSWGHIFLCQYYLRQPIIAFPI